jgi:microcystin-dependent protein
MKKSVLLLLASFLLCFVASAQHKIDEKGFSYQGYARDAGGTALASKSVTVRVRIFPNGNTFNATNDFEEEHNITTDAFGVFHTTIGSIAPAKYKLLEFDRYNYKMTVEAKTATTNYATISNAELLAVPYAKAAANGVPPGTILPFAGETPPAGYLLCDGSSVSSTAYPALSVAIGKAWGGSGSNFNLPDLRGTFMRGVDTRTSGNNDPNATTRTASASGGNTGAKVGTKQGDEFKAHNHGVTDPTHTHDYMDIFYSENGGSVTVTGNYGSGDSDNDNSGFEIKRTTGAKGTGITIKNTGNAETRPKNIAVLYIIKY